MRAPRASAASSGSSTSTPAPSPRRKPSRSRSNGREARLGSSLREVIAWILQKPATPIGLIIESLPPASIHSRSPERIMRNAAPMASVDAAQADTCKSGGRPRRCSRLTRCRQRSDGVCRNVSGCLLVSGWPFRSRTMSGMEKSSRPMPKLSPPLPAVLDATQSVLHALAHAGLDDLRPGDVLAVLGVVRDRVVHRADAALVHEIDDQLELVQALEIRHLRCVARLDQGIEAGFHQLDAAAAEHRLLAEKVGLGFLFERGLDHAGLAAADGRRVGQ